ncbi:MAG: tRNA (adenosine(37)-N6)-threonylcarbamoyltransferase complex transferase subunit TsaD [bacterium]
MRILGIETSCDETAISLIESEGDNDGKAGKENTGFAFKVLADNILSQIALHREFGGVFPMMAKREHAKNIIPLLEKTLEGKDAPETKGSELIELTDIKKEALKRILGEREPGLLERLLNSPLFGGKESKKFKKPDIDVIAVTEGPGLEPALWVGINFALALSEIWEIPVVPTNHMEGHIVSSIFHDGKVEKISFPALALLISGGHTEIVHVHEIGQYSTIGGTRDDAVGEAFDKVARLLGMPYPGGPEVSKYAELRQKEKGFEKAKYPLPRPMLSSVDLDFSFSGIKTAVLYTVKKIHGIGENPEIMEDARKEISWEFQNAVTEVLIKKVEKAINDLGVKDLLIGGGVIANTFIRNSFTKFAKEQNITLHLPAKSSAGDNALMIAVAGALKFARENERNATADKMGAKKPAAGEIRARGGLSL